jgi:hypothetical protein
MGVVIEICVKYPQGPTRMNVADLCRHTRDSSKISVNKINNFRESDYPKVLRGAKHIFRKKNAMQ